MYQERDQPTEEERLLFQQQEHIDAAARQRDLPIRYDLVLPHEPTHAVTESGNYEYWVFADQNATRPLQIFSHELMRSTGFTPQEALDLLNTLEPHRAALEQLATEEAKKQQEPQTPLPLQERINNLFGDRLNRP